ncbi:CopG family ribbon-helix-helix protein [Streptomyces sp. NPDC016172]|uniref:CopG family ribbon-helix-helix protein n=1 Tax=Streptomyces sp. NPDC016172 TaxID=3364964 RepID=UPI0037035A95
MSHLDLPLDPALRTALDDLADAQGRTPEELALEAVRGYLRQEDGRVRAVAEGLARHHADLLRRLGE